MDEGCVTATPAALELIEHLGTKHGPLVSIQSGGCCEGSAPMCVRRGDLPVGSGDVRLGAIGGYDFYIDRDQYARWNEPHLVIDVSDEPSDSFSLEGPRGRALHGRAPRGAVRVRPAGLIRRLYRIVRLAAGRHTTRPAREGCPGLPWTSRDDHPAPRLRAAPPVNR